MDHNGVSEVSALFGRIADRFAASGDGSSLLRENITLLVLYSSMIEGNRLNKSTASLLINGSLETGDGRIADYIELLNHKAVYKRITEIGDRKILSEDIIEIHEALFHNLLNNLYSGPRRGMTSVEDFITEGSENILQDISSMAKILNRDASSPIETFSNALDFHIAFVDKHPFEDGNGRSARILMNWYLLKNGLAPVLITENEKRDYFNSLGPTHFCGYSDAFASFMLYAMVKGAGMDVGEFTASIGMTAEERPIKDFLMIFDGKMDQNAIAKEVSALYTSGNKWARLGAVWMAGYLKMQPRELADAIRSDDSDLASIALLSMLKRAADGAADGVTELTKQTNRIRDMALNGPRLERLLAISALGKMWALDEATASMLLDGQKDVRVVAQIFNAMRYNQKNSDSVVLINNYTSSKELAVSLDAHLALLVNDSVDASERRLRHIHLERDEVKDEIIKWLGRLKKDGPSGRQSMINLNGISNVLVEAAVKDSRIRKLLLGHLSLADSLNPAYLDLLKGVAKDPKADEAERAYAAYCIGRSMGYSYLHSETGLSVNSSNCLLVNMAVFISMTSEKGHEKEVLDALDVRDNSLNVVEAVSISKMLSADTFGADFLSRCRKSFHAWKERHPNG